MKLFKKFVLTSTILAPFRVNAHFENTLPRHNYLPSMKQAQEWRQQDEYAKIEYGWKNHFSGHEISHIQRKLFRLGFYGQEIDGIMDEETREAIRDFQIQNELRMTGVLDEPTLLELNLY
ncbi:MAG: peptidoglycan-binding protein [Halobacteriovoraceae bacterium]|nr:peptidoglycan-binding protein [Halobacteriovoraceae bacterium]